MKIALANPRWDFEGSIYFGCRAPHLPLEFGYARELLQSAGHDVMLLDAHSRELSMDEASSEIRRFGPDMTVIATAPTYLFWRCTQPELRIPQQTLSALEGSGGLTIAVGPHGSVTPAATLRKLGVDIVVLGECEGALVDIAADPRRKVDGTAAITAHGIEIRGSPRATDMALLPPIHWDDETIHRHRHHHHRFDSDPTGPGAEVEASRGCPYRCSFCAKAEFRDVYRRRELTALLSEIDGLISQGVEYIYFIDEIFLPNRPLLEALESRKIVFGIQTRIDLWGADVLDSLGRAGCVSVEAGVESLTEDGRASLDKKCRLSTTELADRLIHARKSIPFVQANLIATAEDRPELIDEWRTRLRKNGIWANDPVPLFPYPSAPEYRRLFGAPDDFAWERAHAHYLTQFERFSEIQECRPKPLHELEAACPRS